MPLTETRKKRCDSRQEGGKTQLCFSTSVVRGLLTSRDDFLQPVRSVPWEQGDGLRQGRDVTAKA